MYATTVNRYYFNQKEHKTSHKEYLTLKNTLIFFKL